MTSIAADHACRALAANGRRAEMHAQPGSWDAMLLSRLKEILASRQLSALFQPIVNLQRGEILGYEGLIRGPSDSPLHSPLNLFKVARANNLSVEVEHMCRRVVLERFAELDLPGKLFLNVSPEMLLQPRARHGETLGYIHELGINPERVIIELTENQPTCDYDLMREAVVHYRGMGFQIAIDDLGEGFSSLRLWSELRPEYVKIDMHFVQGVNQDAVKLQFVRSIQEIARESGSTAIAEGIETQNEMLLLRELGIACGQGYHIARPHAQPAAELPAGIARLLSHTELKLSPQRSTPRQKIVTARKLLRMVTPVSPAMTSNEVYEVFTGNPSLEIVPVVDEGVPVGLIARPSPCDVDDNEPCTSLMDARPIVIDQNTGLQELGEIMAAADRRHLSTGFIITDGGRYLGMGSGHDLMREITRMLSVQQAVCTAAQAKKQAKKIPGDSPFIERHQG